MHSKTNGWSRAGCAVVLDVHAVSRARRLASFLHEAQLQYAQGFPVGCIPLRSRLVTVCSVKITKALAVTSITLLLHAASPTAASFVDAPAHAVTLMLPALRMCQAFRKASHLEGVKPLVTCKHPDQTPAAKYVASPAGLSSFCHAACATVMSDMVMLNGRQHNSLDNANEAGLQLQG